jgi:ribonuclease P protein component
MMKFSRQSRLLKPAEFKLVFQKPIRSTDDLARANGRQRHRLGMAVSRKACSKAVGRNRIKRVIRESFRKRMLVQDMDQTLDLVVLPTVTATNQSNKALDTSLQAHWQRLIRIAENRETGDRPDQQRIQT